MGPVFLGAAAAAACFFFLLSADAVEDTNSVKANSNIEAARVYRKLMDFLRTANILENLLLPLPGGQVFMTSGAKCQIVGLVLDQQIGLRRCVWLVAGQAINFGLYFGDICRIHNVRNRMSSHRMPQSILQGQDDDLVLRVVIVRKLHGAVEDGDHVLSFQRLGSGLGPVTFQAERIDGLSPQEMFVVSAMRLVASSASLCEGRLMQVRLFHLIALLAVAGKTGVHRIGLDEAGCPTGMRIVTSGAIALGAWMLHLGFFNFFRLLAVAGHANRLWLGLRQDDLAVLSRLV